MSTQFYLFEKLGLQTDRFLNLAASEKGKSDVELWLYASGSKTPKKPINLILKGRKKVDVMYAGMFFAVNQRTLDVINQAKLIGAATFPLRIPKAGEIFYGLAFSGKGGFVAKGSTTRSIKFSLDAWDGSDFFTLSNTYLSIVSLNVVDAFSKARISGVVFTPVIAE